MARNHFLIPAGLSSSPIIANTAVAAGSDRPTVLAVLVSMIDAASTSPFVGDLSAWDASAVAEFLGLDPTDIEQIVTAFHKAGVIRTRISMEWSVFNQPEE